ncbi:hypothetical protein [Ramlibacter aquaticus]|uniref:hypothetical protein n=1 Tax=Ramlibacter aquaticus TaxID=2780094 RepID=UPI002AB0DDCC|nr:hypothetical protein [Ramlibacter aquaticus]
MTSLKENAMKKLMIGAACALLFCNFAMATESCDVKAAAKQLSDTAKASFTNKCEADAKTSVPTTCDEQAGSKKLAGAAKTRFLKKCNANAGATGAAASCDTQATEKKVAGAAKTSFVKKCVADAKG